MSDREGGGVAVCRLLEDDPLEPFEGTILGTEEVLVSVDPEDRTLPAGWELPGAAAASEGRAVRSLLWRPDATAGEISAIEVDVASLAGGLVRLEWATEGETGGSSGSMILRRRDARGPDSERLRFDTPAHRRWRGRLAWVRLSIEGPARPGARLVAVRVLTVRVDEARLASATARGWKAVIDSEWRTALLAVPGLPRRWRLTLPPAARLSFSWAKATVGSLAFHVQLLADDESVVLYERQAAAETAPAWEAVDLSLTEYAGRKVELVFSAEGSAVGSRPQWGFWGNPVVLGRGQAARPRPSVVVISIDTLRADRLSLYGYHRTTSPNIDRWAERRGVVFERAVAPAPWTLPSHASLFTGLEALRHGANFDGPATRLGRELLTLAELFRRSGYLTAAITGGGFVHPSYGFDHGFDSYRFWPGDLPSEGELDDGMSRVRAYIDAAGETPFFLFFHTFEVHSPFDVREPYFSRFSDLPAGAKVIGLRGDPLKQTGFLGTATVLVDAGSGPEAPRDGLEYLPGDLYDSAIAFTDDRLGDLLEALAESGFLDRAIVALVSDHGEALGEHGRWSHGYLWESNLHVPLVLSLPGGRFGGRRISRQVRLLDLMPTVLDAAGIAPPSGIDGISLLPLLEDESAPRPSVAVSYAGSTNRGLALTVGTRRKYVFQDSVWPPARGVGRHFDLLDDPDESHDRSVTDEAIARNLRTLARGILAEGYAGLHVRFSNATQSGVGGELESAWLSPVATKSADLQCDCLQWQGRGRASFEVPRETAYTIVGLHGEPGGWDVAGSFRVAGCPEPIPFRLQSTASRPELPQSVELDVGACSVRHGDGSTPPTGLSVSWVGPAAQRPTAADRDGALAERLRALGYVE